MIYLIASIALIVYLILSAPFQQGDQVRRQENMVQAEIRPVQADFNIQPLPKKEERKEPLHKKLLKKKYENNAEKTENQRNLERINSTNEDHQEYDGLYDETNARFAADSSCVIKAEVISKLGDRIYEHVKRLLINKYASNIEYSRSIHDSVPIQAIQKNESSQRSLAKKINRSDDNGNTLLHRAVLKSDFDMIRMLLQNGADAEFKNKDGKKPCELSEHAAIAEIFGEHANQIDISIFEKKYFATLPMSLFDNRARGKVPVGISFDIHDENSRIKFVLEEPVKNQKIFVLSFNSSLLKEENNFIFVNEKALLKFDGLKTHRKKAPIKNQDGFIGHIKIFRTNGKLFLSGKTRFLEKFIWELTSDGEM